MGSNSSNSKVVIVFHFVPTYDIDLYFKIFLNSRGVTVPDFLVQDSANAKLSRFRDTKDFEFQHLPNWIDLQK